MTLRKGKENNKRQGEKMRPKNTDHKKGANKNKKENEKKR